MKKRFKIPPHFILHSVLIFVNLIIHKPQYSCMKLNIFLKKMADIFLKNISIYNISKTDFYRAFKNKEQSQQNTEGKKKNPVSSNYIK